MTIEKLEQRLLWEIVYEYNIKDVQPVSFNKVSLIETTENNYEGKVGCFTPYRKWEVPVILKIDGHTVSWQINPAEWLTFELPEESQDFETLSGKAKRLEDNGDYANARDKYQEIEMFSRKYGNKEFLAYSILSQAWLSLHKLNDMSTAAEKYTETEKICKAILDKKKIKLILHDQAYLFIKTGDQESALWKYGEYKRKIKDDKVYEDFIATMYPDKVRDKDKSETHSLERPLLDYDELKALDKIVTDAVSRSSILWAQAMSHSGNKKHDEAIALMNEYVELNFKIGDEEKVMKGLHNLGAFMYEMKKYEKALEMFASQEKFCRVLADKKSLRKCLSNQASILHYKLEKYDEAQVKYAEAEPLCLEVDDEKSLIDNLQNQMWIQYEKAGDFESAYNKSQALENLCRKNNDKVKLEFCLKYQYDILKAWGEKKKARSVKRELDTFKK